MQCSFCKKKSVYFRKNEGHYYCKEHFLRAIEKKVRKTIRVNGLVERGDKIAVAMSGGKDSLASLYLLKKIIKDPTVSLVGITIDQGFGRRAKNDAALAAQLCSKIGVEHHIFSFKEEFGKTILEVMKNSEKSYCEVCGVLRRYLLNKKARELKCSKIATGHNLDDECQSILMNFMKGDMLRLARIGAMPFIAKNPKLVPRIKPLISIPEEEVTLFAKLARIKHSKQKCPYRRYNALRGETENFLNRLEKRSHGIKHSILESAKKLKPHIEKQFKEGKIGFCEKCKEPASNRTCKSCKVLGGCT